MKATLIHNPNSGILNGKTPENMADALAEVGYETDYQKSESPDELDRILEKVEGPVVIAGGDGSVRAVATRVIGRNIPLVVLPLGTANNIARSLSGDLDAFEIIAGLGKPFKRTFDVGRLCSPWGVDYFLESLGIGFYASVLKSYEPEKGKSILRGIESIKESLSEYEEPKRFQMVLDGQDISGDYVLVEILNTPSIGPRLRLAPQADPHDGLFDVVRIRKDEQNGFLGYVSGLIKGEIEEQPNVLVNQGRQMEIHWTGFPLHLDEQVLPGNEESLAANGNVNLPKQAFLQVEILHNALEFWLPEIKKEEKEQRKEE